MLQKLLHQYNLSYKSFIEILDNRDNRVWSTNGEKDECTVHLIVKGGRRNYKDMIDRNYQCGHGLLNDGKLVISKYNSH